MHRERQLLAATLDDHVEVGAEKAPRDQTQAKPLSLLLQEERESSTVEVIVEDEDSSRSAASHVVDPMG
jgi:hypothetical protein